MAAATHHHYPENFTGGPAPAPAPAQVQGTKVITPSLGSVSKRYTVPFRSATVRTRTADYGDARHDPALIAELGDIRPETPQMDTRPLNFRSPPVQQQQQQQRYGNMAPPESAFSPPISEFGSTRSRYGRAPQAPRRVSSTRQKLQRRNTIDGRRTDGGSNDDSAGGGIPNLDGTSDMPERKKSSAGNRGMSWLQRPERKDSKHKVPAPAPEPKTKKDKVVVRDRSSTDPGRLVTADATARGNFDVKRTVSSGSRFRKAFSKGADNNIEEESTTTDHGDAVDKVKKWKKRVFSKDFFKNDAKGQKLADRRSSLSTPTEVTEPSSNSAPSVMSDHSNKTVITRHSAKSVKSVKSRSSSDTAASQAASTIDDFQVDGISSVPMDGNATEKVFNDSVIGMIDGKVGVKPRLRCGQQWKPPMITLDLQVISPVDRVPVVVGSGNEIWVAVVLQGLVVGEIDRPGVAGNTSGIGLDVGVLLDISSYTSPECFEEMKREAKRLVEAMETSRDRIAVMTFSPPTFAKRTSSRGHAGLRILNSSGSVAKKQLIEDVSSLQPGLSADPSGRDVAAAVRAAVKTLQNMPSDTSKYGSKRSGHLFLITTKLDIGVIEGNFGGIKIHIIGVGPIFNPTSAMGGEGWCAAMSSPLEMLYGPRLRKVVADGIDIPVSKPPGTNDIKTIINLLRMGIDVGSISGGDLFFYPGEGCRLKGVLGDMSFTRLLPGERRCLMVKLEIGDFPGWDCENLDIDGAERQLQATLGELSSNILTVEAIYRHSHFSAPDVKITSKHVVEVARYEEGCVWSQSKLDLNHGVPTQHLFAADEGRSLSDRARVNSVLVQVLADRHSSARAARQAVEQLRDHVDAPAILRELGYQVYLENRFGFKRPKIDESPDMEAYSGRMMEFFERSLSPDDSKTVVNKPRPIPREYDAAGSDLSMDGGGDGEVVSHSDSELYNTSPRRTQSQVQPYRCRSPDEAKKLWMRLGSGFDDDLGALCMDEDFDVDDGNTLYSPADMVERRNSVGRNSVGQQTLITLRNVRETDFSPWVL